MTDKPGLKSGCSKKELIKILEKIDRERHQTLIKSQKQGPQSKKNDNGCSFTLE